MLPQATGDTAPGHIWPAGR